MNSEHTQAEHTESEQALSLATPIQYAPGVGPHRAERFARLNIATVADLVKHLPHRYEFFAGQSPIAELAIGSLATARGQVMHCRWVSGRGGFGGGRRGGGRFMMAIEDATGVLELVFFNARYLVDKIHPDQTVIVTGKVAMYNDQRQMANPKLQILDADEAAASAGQVDERYRPVYPATEDLRSEQIERIIERVLPDALPQIEDHFDAAYREPRGLPELREAYRMIHQPVDEDEVAAARRRLAYDELLLLQLGFAVKRKHTQTALTAPPLRYSDAIDKHIRQRFPFELTAPQDKVVGEIAGDLQRDRPMNRLLQGDVGSGKTVVALYAMLMAVASEKQGALMAPTELLAEQHHASIAAMLEGSSVRIALLTGSQTQAERANQLRAIERGEIDIIIGTQAILSDAVNFADLALVIVDEQHRFGVIQRAAMRSKTAGENTAPHTLVMTATPIPRTLSLTIFGDLDTSTITGLPPGRQPIATRVVDPEKSDEVYAYVAGRIRQGEQAYIVLPAIDESELGLKDVRSHTKKLEQTHFADLRLATVHGQLKPATRQRIMHRFLKGEIDVIIATTVIEVGVDVPNASLMVVEHAERFGLAQLHQLRGRVGRGSRKSLCVFIAETTTDQAAQRMDAIANTLNGFEIAEVDLNIRGMGEFFGTRQSGLPPLQVADLTQHMALLKLARRDADMIVEEDPRLQSQQHDLLRKRLIKQYGQAIGLGDVA